MTQVTNGFTLTNEQGQAVLYEQNEKGYCYKTGAGQKKTRIGKDEFEQARALNKAQQKKEKKPVKKAE